MGRQKTYFTAFSHKTLGKTPKIEKFTIVIVCKQIQLPFVNTVVLNKFLRITKTKRFSRFIFSFCAIKPKKPTLV